MTAMRALLGLVLVAPVLVACSGGGGDTFTASGTISIGSLKGGVLAAATATTGDRCQGQDELGDFREGAEVVVLDADGSKVAVGELKEGALPENIDKIRDLGFLGCDFAFTVDDIPAGDGLFTLQIGDTEKTFKQSSADDIAITVTDD